MKYKAIEKTYKNCKVTLKKYEDGVISLDVYEYGDEYEKCIFSIDVTDEILTVLQFLNEMEDSGLVKLINEMYNELN